MWAKLYLVLSIAFCNGSVRTANACNDEWTNALHQAAASNAQEGMKELLQKGADINTRSPNGSTILHAAAARGDLSAVRFMIMNEINSKLTDADGFGALHLAAANGHSDVISVLLENGDDVNARAADGSSMLHLAAANNMMGSVKFILQSNNTLMSVKNNDLFTPLVLAERLGHVEIASVLRTAIGDITPPTLIAAAISGTVDGIKSLVFKGADVNGRDGFGWTPLERAVQNNVNIVKFLIDHGAEVNQITYFNGQPRSTALYEAACYGNLAAAKLLVENGADINQIVINGAADTPVAAARSNNHSEVVEYLKSKGGIDIKV